MTTGRECSIIIIISRGLSLPKDIIGMTQRNLPKAPDLTPDAIADGINAARENADRLAKDAQLLFDSGSYSSAAALAILAIEEIGKEPILRRLACWGDAKERASIWNEFKSHHAKSTVGLVSVKFAAGATTLSQTLSTKKDQEKFAQDCENTKQRAVYTRWLGNKQFSRPVNEVSQDRAKELIAIANDLGIGNRLNRVISAEEMALYIKHLHPIEKKGGPQAIRNALVAFENEAIESGLKQATDLEPFLDVT
jgi:AbiV family abortive infection protein